MKLTGTWAQDHAREKLVTLNPTHLLAYTYSKVSAHDIE